MKSTKSGPVPSYLKLPALHRPREKLKTILPLFSKLVLATESVSFPIAQAWFLASPISGLLLEKHAQIPQDLARPDSYTFAKSKGKTFPAFSVN